MLRRWDQGSGFGGVGGDCMVAGVGDFWDMLVGSSMFHHRVHRGHTEGTEVIFSAKA